MARVRFELTLLENGGAELTRNKVSIWASDSDNEFADEFADEFLDENDLEEVLAYLVEAGLMTDEQADDCETYVQSFNGMPSDEPANEAESEEED